MQGKHTKKNSAWKGNISRVIAVTHEKDVVWPKMQLYNTVHEQTIICMQLFAGQKVTPFLM